MPIRNTEPLGLRCWRGSARTMTDAHSHLELEANLIHRGELTYLFGGRRVAVAAGQWALFWGSVPHQLVGLSPNNEVSWLTLPLAHLLSWNIPNGLGAALLQGQVAVQTARSNDDALFADWQTDLASGDAARVRIVELEIEARLRRLALGWRGGETPATPIVGGELAAVEKMAAFMSKHYAEPLQIQQIGHVAGLHPNYAMTVFKRGFGLSPGEFLSRTRVAQVQRLLVTTDRTVLDIALSCGFGSASRFHAVFKKQCGQSPANYRKSLRG